MSADGQAEFPIKGFSEVDTLEIGTWTQILDAENANTPTVVANLGAGNVAIVLPAQPFSVITPPTLSASVTGYNPAGWLSANLIRATPFAGGSDVSGLLAASIQPQPRTWRNIAPIGGDWITFKHEDATEGVAAQRFKSPTGADLALAPQGSLTLYYDVPEARWTVV